MFDVHFLVNRLYETSQGKVSYSIKLAAPPARGGARMKLRLAGTMNRLNVEHRTPNIERPLMKALRFIHFIKREPQITNCRQRLDLKLVEFCWINSLERHRHQCRLWLILKIDRIHYSTLNVQCLMLDVQ